MSEKNLLFKIMYWLLYPIIRPLQQLPAFKAVRISEHIQNLEQNNEYEKANTIRQEWLLKLKGKNTAPLWSSEGNYQLYQKKDYEKALKAFQNAIEALQKFPLNFGASNPMNIYYGATISAISTDQKEAAKGYYKEFLQFYETVNEDKSLRKYTSQYEEGMKWVLEQLQN